MGSDSVRSAVPAAPAPAPAFHVFIDAEFEGGDDKGGGGGGANAAAVRRGPGQTADLRPLRRRANGDAVDRLTQDPLRYLRDPGRAEADRQDNACWNPGTWVPKIGPIT